MKRHHDWVITTRSDSGWLRTDGLVVENLGVAPVGVASSQLPHVKEGLPVDEVHQAVEVKLLKNTRAQDLRAHWKTNPVWKSSETAGYKNRGGPTLTEMDDPANVKL